MEFHLDAEMSSIITWHSDDTPPFELLVTPQLEYPRSFSLICFIAASETLRLSRRSPVLRCRRSLTLFVLGQLKYASDDIDNAFQSLVRLRRIAFKVVYSHR